MLDMKAIIWLENYLQVIYSEFNHNLIWVSSVLSIYNLLFQNLFQTWKSTIFVVSHDRSFLNAVATDILHLHSGVIDNYRGNYESFTKTREERLKNQQKEYEAQKEYRDHIQVQLHVYH